MSIVDAVNMTSGATPSEVPARLAAYGMERYSGRPPPKKRAYVFLRPM
jgi:hypothetical protein